MVKSGKVVILLIVACAFGCSTARRWGGLAAHDAKELITAPKRATPRQWKRAAVLTGVVIAGTALDESVRDAARANQSRAAGDVAEAVEPFGGRYADRVLAGLLLTGVVTGNQKTQAVAFDGIVSSLFASKVVTPLLKNAVHRSRPHEGDQSFPSNHATNAFAVASVMAAHYDSRLVDVSAYGLASLVGLARIHHDDHWLSDVVAGAVIGAAMGRFVVATNEKRRGTWTVAPVVEDRRRGAVVRVVW